jgi:hypothetical protein
MKTYELQVLRYHHDVITGEFVNVGIVLFNKEMQFLRCAVTHRYARLSRFFHAEKTASYVSQTIRSFENYIQRISQELVTELKYYDYTSIDEITSAILPKDDSSLQCSDITKGLSMNFNKTFDDLFIRYVTVYENISMRESRTDEEAWNQVYKKYFDEYGITNSLSKQRLKTENDIFDFDLTYKNGTLHLYNPVSFDLVDHDAIREKVYKWRGKIAEIETTNENINIHMLLLYPENQNQKDKDFINKVLTSSTKKKNLVLHTETNLKSHLKEIKEYISESGVE